MPVVTPTKLAVLEKLYINILKLSGKNRTGLKFVFFERMLNYVRMICLYIIKNNDLYPIIAEKEINLPLPGSPHKEQMLQSLIELFYHIGIISIKENRYYFNAEYTSIFDNEDNFTIERLKEYRMYTDSKGNKLFQDFLFVTDMIKKYRNGSYNLKHTKKNKSAWRKMIWEGWLDREIKLSETFYYLSKFSLGHKIKSPFSEDYFIAGRNTFKNFTQYKFADIFKKIAPTKNGTPHVLDIGCGHGYYIEVLHKKFAHCHVTGLELKEGIYRTARQRLRGLDHIELINEDILRYKTSQKYQIILMNYILFYFNKYNLTRLLSKVNHLLSDDGSVLICQYFSGIEEIKLQLAKHQKEWSPAKKIEIFYSSKMLYAHKLWNDAADTFSESVSWDEFMTLIHDTGFQISSITNADNMYYALFIELKKHKQGQGTSLQQNPISSEFTVQNSAFKA